MVMGKSNKNKQQQVRNKIENKKVWINVTCDTTILSVVADEQECDKCKKWTWILYMSYENKTDKEKKEKLYCLDCLSEDTICEKRYCPFCNRNKEQSLHICKDCALLVIDSNKELYQICQVPLAQCSCKYCRILGRC